ncbi:MAG: hypothetical protein J6X95_00585 [Treponema sp.]|nr:hypothetical protein [Treponema sp.]
MQPVNFKLGADDYQLLPHTGFEAVNLYRKVNGAVGNIISAAPLPKEGEQGKTGFSAFAAAFNSYDDEEFKTLVETTLKNVTVVTAGKKNFTLSDMDGISRHFEQRLGEMYDLMFEVWNIEKMLPFDLAPLADGSGTNKTTM